MKHYDEASVVRALSKKRAIQFTTNGTHITIKVNADSPEVGIRSLGKIDFLLHHAKEHTYSVIFNKTAASSKLPVEGDDANQKKAAKPKRNKLNMAAMVKSVTHKVKLN